MYHDTDPIRSSLASEEERPVDASSNSDSSANKNINLHVHLHTGQTITERPTTTTTTTDGVDPSFKIDVPTIPDSNNLSYIGLGFGIGLIIIGFVVAIKRRDKLNEWVASFRSNFIK